MFENALDENDEKTMKKITKKRDHRKYSEEKKKQINDAAKSLSSARTVVMETYGTLK